MPPSRRSTSSSTRLGTLQHPPSPSSHVTSFMRELVCQTVQNRRLNCFFCKTSLFSKRFGKPFCDSRPIWRSKRFCRKQLNQFRFAQNHFVHSMGKKVSENKPPAPSRTASKGGVGKGHPKPPKPSDGVKCPHWDPVEILVHSLTTSPLTMTRAPSPCVLSLTSSMYSTAMAPPPPSNTVLEPM